MSYTESACAIDLSPQSWLQRHSIKETDADIWRQRFHSVYENIRLRPPTQRRIDGVFKFIHFGERLRVDGRPIRMKTFAFTSICVFVWTGPKAIYHFLFGSPLLLLPILRALDATKGAQAHQPLKWKEILCHLNHQAWHQEQPLRRQGIWVECIPERLKNKMILIISPWEGQLRDHTKNVVGLQSLDVNESNGNSLSNKLTFPSLDKDPSLRFPWCSCTHNLNICCGRIEPPTQPGTKDH